MLLNSGVLVGWANSNSPAQPTVQHNVCVACENSERPPLANAQAAWCTKMWACKEVMLVVTLAGFRSHITGSLSLARPVHEAHTSPKTIAALVFQCYRMCKHHSKDLVALTARLLMLDKVISDVLKPCVEANVTAAMLGSNNRSGSQHCD